MDNPQTKTDELVGRLSEYSYSVDSLQVLAWDELRRLNSDTYFLNEHREIIRHQRLTKLEEIGYVLQLVGELSQDQTGEFRGKIRDLEETKTLLEAQSKGLREQIKFTNQLLDEVVQENAELVERLKNKEKAVGVGKKTVEEFNKLIPVAQEILERRSPSPNQYIIPEVENHQVTKIVNDTVPAFFGTDGPDLHAEVSRFVQGCKMVESELLSGENNGLVQMVIQCLKLRLMGSAYSKIAQLQYGSVDALCNSIKTLFKEKHR
ncbi:hypothetical protein EVAR_102530_1 [Eumeta japonica]|uniref:Uncharacterized protein n=1 Tax=Eumeta variegata TaxID=151549 RepID=A0A4C1SL84_EUMVA|nr:hypothetical protein EVAR_102530_1 [Eumeta japonica]